MIHKKRFLTKPTNLLPQVDILRYLNCMSEYEHEHEHVKADRWGLAVSGVCILHCFGTAGLLAFLPLLSSFTHTDHWIHVGLAFILIPLAIYAVTAGFKHHKKTLVPFLAIIGGMSVIIGASIPLLNSNTHQHLDPHLGQPEIFLTICGSSLLMVSHALNIFFCRNRPNHSHHCKVGN